MFKGHKVIVIGDAHDSPNIKQDRFKWIGKYIKAAKPDYIIQIGDWASFDSLSFFQKNETLRWVFTNLSIIAFLISLIRFLKFKSMDPSTLKKCSLLKLV